MGFKIIRKIAGKTYMFDEDKMELIGKIRYLVKVPYTSEPRFVRSKQATLYRGIIDGHFVIKYRNYEDSAWLFDIFTSNANLLGYLINDDASENVEIAEKLFGPFEQG